MNGRESDSQARDAPPRLALITPSASPPSSRSLSLLSSRISLDRPPPTKRPRLGSTPSSPFSVSTPAPSTADQIDAQRREASQRLMDIWAGLAERYNRPLDEDDIIDLRDGSIIKDRGVLRRAEKTYEVGYFAGEDAPSDANDANSDYGGVQTDDDVDPLDAFAPEADISGELELEKEKRHVPPVRALDPADAEDLREFLEAERLRKEQYGDEDDEEEVVRLMSETGPLAPHGGSERRASLAGDEQQLDDNVNSGCVVANYGDDKDGLHDTSEKPPPVPSNGLSVDDDESEDEFATWDFDTTTPVKPTNTRRPLTPVDVIDLTESPLSSPSHASTSRGRSTIPVKLTNIQPEAARGKSVPRGSARTPARAKSIAQDDAVAKGRAPSRAKTPARSKTPARRKSSMPPPPLPQAFIGQLATPPPSSSSVIESTPETRASFTPKSLSPSPPPSPPPLPKPRPRPRYQGALRVSSSPTVENPQAAPATHNTQSGANPRTPKAPKYKLVPEVVITTRAHPAGSSLQTSSSAPDAEPFSVGKADAEQPHVRGEASRRGNTKENNGRRKTVNNDAGRAHAQRSALDKEPTDGRATTSDVDQRDFDSDIPPRPKQRKRKRVLSSSSLSGTSDKEDPFPTIIPIAPPRSRRRNVPKDVPGPSSSRRTPKPVRKTTQSVDDDDSDDTGPEPPPPLPPPRARTPYRQSPLATEYHGAPPPIPYTPQHRDSYIPLPPGVVHDDPDAQMRFMQAAHYLSYLMSGAASMPPSPGYPPGYPPPFPFPTQRPQWLPWTPHRSHRPQGDRQSDLASSDAGPSGPSRYNTPSHPHPYPFTFDPSYSSASLPPSSPPASSEPPSPIVRSSSLARGRSKSRGRRVSFKLSDEEISHPPRLSNEEEPERETASSSRRTQPREDDTNDRSATRKARSRISGRAGTPAVKADKGKARAEVTDGSDGSDSDRGRKRERGRTPEPPAHRERSASARGKA